MSMTRHVVDYLILFLFLDVITITKADEILIEGIKPFQIDENGNTINETFKYYKNEDIKTEKVAGIDTSNVYSIIRTKQKFAMSRLERAAAKKYLYEKYLKKKRNENKDHDLFGQLKEYNRMKGYTVSKGTCDRRSLKVCKNACMRVYRRICDEIKCRRLFKEEIKKNCVKICRLEFKQEFNNIF